MKLRNRDLWEIYLTYNERYFRDSLPCVQEMIDVKFAKADSPICLRHDLAAAQPWLNGTYDIEINSKYNDAPVICRWSILHEMTHVYLDMKGLPFNHGHYFQREMKRLANIGAFSRIW